MRYKRRSVRRRLLAVVLQSLLLVTSCLRQESKRETRKKQGRVRQRLLAAALQSLLLLASCLRQENENKLREKLREQKAQAKPAVSGRRRA